MMKEWIGVDPDAIEKGAVGFVYLINFRDKFYIGKKSLLYNKTITRKSKISGKPIKSKKISEANWKTYYSSHKYLTEMMKEHSDEFERIILRYCYSKKELTYREMEYQVKYNCLEREDCLNENILGKFFKRDLKNENKDTK